MGWVYIILDSALVEVKDFIFYFIFGIFFKFAASFLSSFRFENNLLDILFDFIFYMHITHYQVKKIAQIKMIFLRGVKL